MCSQYVDLFHSRVLRYIHVDSVFMHVWFANIMIFNANNSKVFVVWVFLQIIEHVSQLFATYELNNAALNARIHLYVCLFQV